MEKINLNPSWEDRSSRGFRGTKVEKKPFLLEADSVFAGEDKVGIVPSSVRTLKVCYCCASSFKMSDKVAPSIICLDLSSHAQIGHIQQNAESGGNPAKPATFKSIALERYRLPAMVGSLTSLILRDVYLSNDDMKAIVTLQFLQNLDISRMLCRHTRTSPNMTVWMLMVLLRNLSSLDVSSTSIGDQLYLEKKRSSQVRLRSSSNSVVTASEQETVTLAQQPIRRLNFIGLFGTKGCEVEDVPRLAFKVSGHNTEKQIVTSLKRYVDLPVRLAATLKQILKLAKISRTAEICEAIFDVLFHHPLDENLHMICHDIVRYFDQCEVTKQINDEEYANILRLVCDCLEMNKSNPEMVELVIWFLRTLPLAEDVELGNDKLLLLLARIVESHGENMIVCQIAYCTAIDVDSTALKDASTVDKLEIVTILIRTIKRINYQQLTEPVNTARGSFAGSFSEGPLHDQPFDEVAFTRWWTLNWTWAFLANIVDQNDEIGMEVLRQGGIEQIETCEQRFSGRFELKNSTSTLLVRLAESRTCRLHLLRAHVLEQLRETFVDALALHRFDIAFQCCYVFALLLTLHRQRWDALDPDLKHADYLLRLQMNTIYLFDALASNDAYDAVDLEFSSVKALVDLVKTNDPILVEFAVQLAHLFVHRNPSEGFMILLKQEQAVKPLLESLHGTSPFVVRTNDVKKMAGEILKDIGLMREERRVRRIRRSRSAKMQDPMSPVKASVTDARLSQGASVVRRLSFSRPNFLRRLSSATRRKSSTRDDIARRKSSYGVHTMETIRQSE